MRHRTETSTDRLLRAKLSAVAQELRHAESELKRQVADLPGSATDHEGEFRLETEAERRAEQLSELAAELEGASIDEESVPFGNQPARARG